MSRDFGHGMVVYKEYNHIDTVAMKDSAGSGEMLAACCTWTITCTTLSPTQEAY